MSNEERSLFEEALSKGSRYLEYGSGGSTLIALRTPSLGKIDSVESDADFIEKHLKPDGLVDENLKSGRLRFLIPRIGKLGAWGHPVDREAEHLYPNYALCPWFDRAKPDIILVDGRFRVASALATLIECPGGTLLIHDFNRSLYRVLDAFVSIYDAVGTLVVGQRSADFDEKRARKLLKRYLYAPDESVPSLPAKARHFLARKSITSR